MENKKKFTLNPVLKKLDEGNKWDKELSTNVANYINSPEFTEKDYIDLKSGIYPNLANDHMYYFNRIKDALNSSKYHTPENLDKVVDQAYNIYNKIKSHNESVESGKNTRQEKRDLRDYSSIISNILTEEPLSSKTIHKIISDPKYAYENRYGNEKPPLRILENENIKPEHLYKFVASHPSEAGRVLTHHLADDRLHDLVFNNKEALQSLDSEDLRKIVYRHEPQDETHPSRLKPAHAKAIMERVDNRLYGSNFDRVLGAMHENDRKEYIDKKLGITGGKSAGSANWQTGNEAENRENEGWNDWEHGPDYDKHITRNLSSSKFLDDSQIEHIKRRGDFDSKYELYHNNKIDPKHGAEMFKLWHDNNENKGYSAQELNDRFKDDKDDIFTLDDIDQNELDEDATYEYADESAREAYPFEEWVSDNKDKILKEGKFDIDTDELYDKLHSDHDWTGENPDFNKELHENHQKILDNMENGSIHIDKLAEITGKDPKELEAHAFADSDGNISEDDLNDYMKDNNPEEIDFSNHDNYTINDHPDFEDRYTEAEDELKEKQLDYDPYKHWEDWYDDHQNSDEYREAWDKAKKEALEEQAKPLYEELYNNAHKDERFIPEHIKPHVLNLDQLRKLRQKTSGEPAEFLDKHIPNRSYDLSYGDDQHLHELLKDYSEANGGSIDIGKMHKLMPNNGDVWKKIFGPKGKLTSSEIDQKIDALPKQDYYVSYGKWDDKNMQNINNRDQVVVRLDLSDAMEKQMKDQDPGLYNTFKKISETSKRSGHPTKDRTIAWARVDMTDPKHYMIDEVQSDFGKTVRQFLQKEGKESESSHVSKIEDMFKNWREALFNHVIKEAKKHGVERVSTHSPESKSSHTWSSKVHTVYNDSYKKVPRKMGFKPSKAEELPLTEDALSNTFNKIKNTKKDIESAAEDHEMGWKHHKEKANVFNHLSEMWKDKPDILPKLQTHIDHHENMANQHRERALKLGVPHDNVSVFPINTPDTYDIEHASQQMRENVLGSHRADEALKEPMPDINAKPEYHETHTYDVKPNVVKNIEIINDLMKSEEKVYIQYKKYGKVLKEDLIKINNLRKLLNNDFN